MSGILDPEKSGGDWPGLSNALSEAYAYGCSRCDERLNIVIEKLEIENARLCEQVKKEIEARDAAVRERDAALGKASMDLKFYTIDEGVIADLKEQASRLERHSENRQSRLESIKAEDEKLVNSYSEAIMRIAAELGEFYNGDVVTASGCVEGVGAMRAALEAAQAARVTNLVSPEMHVKAPSFPAEFTIADDECIVSPVGDFEFVVRKKR